MSSSVGAVARVSAHAKVNLLLRIVGRRPDGYHEIESVFHSVALHDRVRISRAGGAEGTGELRPCRPAPSSAVKLHVRWIPGALSTDGDAPRVGTGRDNLARRAAELWTARAGVREPLRIELEKAIPVGSGLGGGSADAAAVLLGLQTLWRAEGRALGAADLFDVAGRLGADVPFCLRGGAARVFGIGERMEPSPIREGWVVLVKPPFSVSTGWAYAEWDRMRAAGVSPDGDLKRDEAAAAPDSSARLERAAPFNALEPVVARAHPELAAFRERLVAAGASEVRMTGSGSALFGLARNETEALTVAERAVNDGAGVEGPIAVPGANLFQTDRVSAWVTRLIDPGEERVRPAAGSPRST